MGARVFISYSSDDQAAAEAVCTALEAEGISCWIAHRDLAAGSQWGGGIVRAIEDCQAVVVVFSANANNSPQVAREMELAVGKRRPLIPVRIRDEMPTADMQYFLGVSHWFNAFPGPIDNYLARVFELVRRVLDQEAQPWAVLTRRLHDISGGKITPKMLAGGAVVLLVLLVLLFRHGDNNGMPPNPFGAPPSALVGRWQATIKDQRGRDSECQLDIDKNGMARFSDGCPLELADTQGQVSAMTNQTFAPQIFKAGDDGTFLFQGANGFAGAYRTEGDKLITRDDKRGEVSWAEGDASAPLLQSALPRLPALVAWPLTGVPMLVAKTSAFLRGKWQDDALPMSIDIKLNNSASAPDADGTVPRDAVDARLEYYSPSTQQGMSVELAGNMIPPFFPLGVIDRDPDRAIPTNFLDLPFAVRVAQANGMRAKIITEAQLENWGRGTSYGSASLNGIEWMIDTGLSERLVVRAF